jgi:MFS transporter, PAT family, beta-lactamase induction signal transducer AmpG
VSDVAPEPKKRRSPPPWIFVFGGTAYGVSGTFTAAIMPFAMERAKVPLGTIGTFGSLMLLPSIFQFLYGPIVDVGPRRKIWLVTTALLSALCLIGAFSMPLPDQLTGYVAFGIAAAMFAGLIGACNGALIATTIPDEHRGAASAWYNVGNLSGGGIAGWLGIYMLGHDISPVLVGLAVSGITIVPSLVMLLVFEPRKEHSKKLGEVLGQTLHEVGEVMSSRSALTGMALCLSPVGTCALVNYFSGMTKDYQVSADVAAAVSGAGPVVLTAVGALAGGYLADRVNRRLLYLSSGVLAAICAVVMAMAPRVELTYIVGVAIYNLITGLSYSVFTAFVLETIGDGGKSAATRYTMYVSAANFAITYVGWIDTRFKEDYGVEGVIASDALLEVVGVVILGLVFWKLRSFGTRRRSRPVLPQVVARDRD